MNIQPLHCIVMALLLTVIATTGHFSIADTILPGISRLDIDHVSLRPVQDIHDELLSRFTPVEQPEGDVAINHSGDLPFTGDCDDYYAAAFNQLYTFGYDPYALIMAVRSTGKKHIVACVKIKGRSVCMDHNRMKTSSFRDLKRSYVLLEKREVQ